MRPEQENDAFITRLLFVAALTNVNVAPGFATDGRSRLSRFDPVFSAALVGRLLPK